MWNALDDSIQDVLHALTGFSTCTDNILRITTNQVDDFVFHLVRHGRRHVNLVDNRNYLEVIIDSQIEIRNSLCLYTLCSVNHQQGTLTGSYGTRHFIREVHVSRGINEVQNIFFTLVHILHLDGVALNRNAALALQIHVVQHLSLRHLDGLGELQQTVGQRRLPMVDMCNDAEISYMIHNRENTNSFAKIHKKIETTYTSVQILNFFSFRLFEFENSRRRITLENL